MSKTHLDDSGVPHQTTDTQDETLTTDQGAPIADDQNSLMAGPRGPVLLEDHILREKIFHFDHERIPERVVHARGYLRVVAVAAHIAHWSMLQHFRLAR